MVMRSFRVIILMHNNQTTIGSEDEVHGQILLYMNCETIHCTCMYLRADSESISLSRSFVYLRFIFFSYFCSLFHEILILNVILGKISW